MYDDAVGPALSTKLAALVVGVEIGSVDRGDDEEMAVLMVVQPDMAELCCDRTELTPEATVALLGIPVMIPLLLVMVV